MKKNALKKLFNELVKLLQKDEMTEATLIYYNGHRYEFSKDGKLIDEGEFDVSDYLVYCNPDTISLSFEGPLYDKINYYEYPELDELLKKHGLYYELGNYWNMSFYED